jgi:hypothetical protein
MGLKETRLTEEWRKIHNEKLKDLYCSPTIVRFIKSRKIRWAGHVVWMGWEKRVHGLVVKPEGKTSLGRPRYRWEDNIKMAVLEVGCGVMDWIGLALDRDRHL